MKLKHRVREAKNLIEMIVDRTYVLSFPYTYTVYRMMHPQLFLLRYEHCSSPRILHLRFQCYSDTCQAENIEV